MGEMRDTDDWLTRTLPEDFFSKAGKHSKEEMQKLFAEIPDDYKVLAYSMITLVTKCMPEMSRCFEFRQILYLLYKRLLDGNEIDIELPHYWFADGVMIEPEWIVRITNGIIGWICDDSREECLMQGECRYYPGGEP